MIKTKGMEDIELLDTIMSMQPHTHSSTDNNKHTPRVLNLSRLEEEY